MKTQTIDSFLKERLQSLRKNGWTLTQIAQQSGISQPTISRYLNGELSLRLASADKLYAFLVCNPIATDKPVNKKLHHN